MSLSSRRRIAALTASVLALLGALTVTAPAPARAAEVPDGFFGLGHWSHPSDAQSAELGRSGLRVFRASLGWDDVEEVPGVRKWVYVDALVDRAARDGYDLLFVLNGCTEWACGSVETPPKDEPVLSWYRDFVAEAVRRYGANGSYRPAGSRPRVMWQVGNEVNGGHYFGKHPQPSAYSAFLAAIGSTIKRVDGTATVVASGLVEKPGDADGAFLEPFLRALYQQPGYAKSFDVAAVHGYAENPAGTQRVLDLMRRVTIEAGDGSRPLWITEMSWATGGPAHTFNVGEATQAAYLRDSWDTLLACRSRWNLDKVMWFGHADVDASTLGLADYWGVHNGLLYSNASPKPAYASFLEYLSGRLPAGRAETCGLSGGTSLDILDPDTTITQAPGITPHVTGMTVSFTSNEGDARFECSMDGIEAWTACTAPRRVDSTREGIHWLRVRAVDPQGNADPTPARAEWTLDLTAPDTEITGGSPTLTRDSILKVGFAGRDAVGIAGYECRSGGADWQPCTSPYQTPALQPGWHTVDIRAIDLAGRRDPSPASPSFKIDPSLPAGATPASSPASSPGSSPGSSPTSSPTAKPKAAPKAMPQAAPKAAKAKSKAKPKKARCAAKRKPKRGARGKRRAGCAKKKATKKASARKRTR
ncbi:MAG: hypothetical protein M3P50_07665 [Actinomycetota bacterium]|nr:hypothetical protein [Actinomycetota bacterium]